VGVFLDLVSRSPSCPFSLFPHKYTFPFSLKNAEWCSPQETLVIFLSENSGIIRGTVNTLSGPYPSFRYH